MNIDKDVLQARLTRLQSHFARIDDRCPPTLDALVSNPDMQDIIAHNLEKAIQVCVDISTHICAAHGRSAANAADSFDVLADLGLIEPGLSRKLRKAVGFRNIAVHEYAEIDWAVVLRIARDDIRDLKDFGKTVASLITEPPHPGVRS